MKKLLSLFALVLLASCVFAQNNPITMVGTATITNAATNSVTLTVDGNYRTVSFQALVTKLTGTVTGTTAILSGSVDGTNFVNLNTDTLTCTSATINTKIWVLEGTSFRYYKITFLGTGTMTAQIKGYAFLTPQLGKHAVSNMLSDYSVAGDTITNTGSGYVQLQVKGSYSSVSIQAVSTKISGTAAGTITLQGSNDGTNFVTISTGYLRDMTVSSPYAISGTATLTVLNQTTTTKVFTVIRSPYAYYRISHTGSGTMVSRLRGYILPNN